MSRPTAFWIDLRVEQPNHLLEETLSSTCNVYRQTDLISLPSTICRIAPRFIVFDFDCPHVDELTALQETKAQYPAQPILMLTEHHCEALAVWAFRAGAWDYLHSPVRKEDLVARIKLLCDIPIETRRIRRRVNSQPLIAVPRDVCGDRRPSHLKTLERPIDYIVAHISTRITLNEVAEHCGMNPFAFSRGFKGRYGVTFQEFVIQRRVGKAQQLLTNSGLSITDVAEASGFRDLSHFIRTFRRVVGSTPSAYRKRDPLLPHSSSPCLQD